MTSKSSDERSTPQDLFNYADVKWGPFTLDACASDSNAKCKVYWTASHNSLIQPWHGVVWCNPPYSRGNTEPFVERAAWAVTHGPADRVVMLLPVTTSNRWWQRNFRKAAFIEFLPCRIRFGESKTGAFFDSCFWVFERGVSGGIIAVSTYQRVMSGERE